MQLEPQKVWVCKMLKYQPRMPYFNFIFIDIFSFVKLFKLIYVL